MYFNKKEYLKLTIWTFWLEETIYTRLSSIYNGMQLAYKYVAETDLHFKILCRY